MNSVETMGEHIEQETTEKTNPELEEEIKDLKSRIAGLEASVARLLEDREQLQRTGQLNEDPNPEQERIEQERLEKLNNLK
ncbi:MAG: hypothetical protein M1324_02040 [Patescibacteria group bacterium]|nr:hypothetical protein [Patescibacteria group bacterium]MCL5410617.1 hypothetical protein [Patescibacteria group bacterium]